MVNYENDLKKYIENLDLSNEVKKYIENLSAPNIAVIGLTGVGKSSLINKIFGMNITIAGAGRAITKDYTKYSPSDFGIDLPVNLYDSPGYEPGIGEKDFVKETIDFLNKKKHLGKEEQIHLIWYLINASTARLTQADIDILEEINQNNVPAIILLSKSDIAQPHQKEDIKKAIEKTEFSKVYKTVEVGAEPLILPNGEQICKPFGMKELIEITTKLLPKIYVDAFIVAQTVDIKSKKELAWTYVREASLACFGVGAVPIPLTAPTAAIGALGYMYSQIIVLYGHTNQRWLLAISGMTAGGVLTLVTDGLVDLFSSTFPGISIFAASGAATFTAVSGMAFTNTCERLAIEKLTGSETEIEQQLRRIFQAEFRKYSSLKIYQPSNLDKVRRDFIGN
ncbi:MAG: GTPase domain-containing protein [Okeania sp. SIO3B5]|uniref:GTPase domain-containing protein n=1 Tax=Okeania sp. SIO3B5 TaxID=2607811 RepID=UPI0013FFC3E3|nr:GTPase domain-containing protein [Okeania sp. SIO3B5]NEO55560.1 GTPase domain-containing protein [Okeania sp. SIO3B5]